MSVDMSSAAAGHLLLRGGRIVDGTGQPAFVADLRVRGERIAELGQSLSPEGARVIDASGSVVAPGFIDVHTHDDQALLASPEMLPKLSQGVTTVVVGNCGISMAPLVSPHVPPPLDLLGSADKYRFPTMRSYVEALAQAQPAVNVAALVGHSTLRVATMADPYGPATAQEQARMIELTQEAMAAGATGMSTGIFYAPSAAADIAEVVKLARVVAKAGGVYATHIRDEHDKVLESLEEAFTSARLAHIPIVISHHKCAGPANWGRTVQTLAYIDAARKRQAIGLDAYPYVAGSTILRKDLVDGVIQVLITRSEPHPEMIGRWLADIAREWGCSQQEACDRLQPGGACYFQMHEDDVQRVLKYPATMIGSDGLPHDKHPHPRLWGTFPRVLGHYSRELKLFPLEEAVRRMTGLSAAQYHLHDRGLLAPGKFADVVVFDPDTIMDRATFEDPAQPATGITLVMVNGALSYQPAVGVTHRAGRFLRGRHAQ
jgi:N-acyl-D-amino-acid deacylase